MGRVIVCLAALAAAIPGASRAQPVMIPATPGYAINPPLPNTPLQQQMMQDYRTDLRQAQRELSLQNPSGLSREQLDVTHRLNTMAPPPNPVPSR
jgi:hypothetical protein